MSLKKKSSYVFETEQDALPYIPFSRPDPTVLATPAVGLPPEESFDSEQIQKISVGTHLETQAGLVIYNNNSRLEISEYNWFGYHSNTLLVGEKSTVTFSLGSQGLSEFSFDYFALHNSSTVINFYDIDNNLIGSEKLLYTGSVSAKQFIIKTLHFIAPAGTQIARAELVTGDEPSVGDYGFHVDNVKWVIAGILPVDFTFTRMEKDTGIDATDFITNNGSANRNVQGTLSRTLSSSETLQFWDGTKWVNAKVSGKNWEAQDNTTHTADWEYKLRIIDKNGNTTPEQSQQVVLLLTPPEVQVIYDHMDKDDGVEKDWRTSDGSAGRNVYGTLTKALNPGDVIEYSLDDGKTWQLLTVNGLNWSFIDDVVHDAHWEYQIRITDIAGNISAPFKQNAFLETRFVEVTIDGISKDSGLGSRDGDFITRDGAAGRLVQGSLSEELEPGEKVQVSFDNGITWHDARHDGKKWFAVDNGVHNADWVIKARIANASSYGSEQQQIVHYAPDKVLPPDLAWDGKTLTATLPAKAVAGETLQFIIDGKSVVVTLTAGDIASKTFKLPWTEMAQNFRVSYIDTAGNNTDWRVLKPTVEHIATETFSGQKKQSIYQGQKFNFASFELVALKVSNYSFINRFGSTNQGGIGSPPQSMALEIANGTGGTNYRLNIKKTGTPVNKISFTVGDLNTYERIEAVFYDSNGREVFRDFRTGHSGLTHVIGFTLPYGQTFDSVVLKLESPNSYVWIDDIVFNNVTYYNTSIEPPSTLQVINQSTLYMGSDNDDVFQLSDASLVNNKDFCLRGQYGIDTLQLTGKNIHLDLTALAGKVQSTEIINLTGTGNNTLSLTLGDVLQQGGKDLFNHSGNVQMMIKGNAGDKVNLSDLLPTGADVGNWNNSGNVTVGGVVYSVWQHDSLDAELLVQSSVTMNLINH